MTAFVLRRAGPADSEFAYFVKKTTFRAYVEKLWGWNEEVQRQYHEEHFATQDFRIISVSGTDAGVLAIKHEPEFLHLCQLFLLPEHQGKGIGTKCILEVIGEARALGLPVRLRVLKDNSRAQALYRRMGFVQIYEIDTHLIMERAS